MNGYKIVVLIDGSGNVSFERIPEDKLDIYLSNKEAECYIFSVVEPSCFEIFEGASGTQLRFELYDADEDSLRE